MHATDDASERRMRAPVDEAGRATFDDAPLGAWMGRVESFEASIDHAGQGLVELTVEGHGFITGQLPKFAIGSIHQVTLVRTGEWIDNPNDPWAHYASWCEVPVRAGDRGVAIRLQSR